MTHLFAIDGTPVLSRGEQQFLTTFKQRLDVLDDIRTEAQVALAQDDVELARRVCGRLLGLGMFLTGVAQQNLDGDTP